MANVNEKMDVRETHLLGAAGELVDLLYRWNVIDEYDLVIENSAKGTPYHHITTALWEILVLLGVKNPESKMSFYEIDRKSTRLNSSHVKISYAVFCL